MRKTLSIVTLFLCSILLSGCNPLQSKNVSGLQVITHDISASLFLNDEYLDKTPYINKKIKPGVYKLRIEPDDKKLVPYETEITMNKGLLTVVTWKSGESPETSGGVIYEMEKIANDKTEISFTTVPDNTIISFNNQEQQFTPLTISDVIPGEYEYEVFLPSYETQKHTLNVAAGHRINVSIVLAKNRTELESNLEEEKTAKVVEDSAEVIKKSLSNGNGESTEIEGKKVKIKPTNYFRNGVEVLRVRSEANSDAEEIGFANSGQEYKYLETKDNWYKIEFSNKEGWVNNGLAELIE